MTGSWQRASLQEVAEIVTGTTPLTHESSYYGGAIPFVTPAELDAEDPLTTAKVYLSALGAERGRLLPKGSVLVSCIGSLGKVGIAGVSLVTNQQINALVFNPDRVFPRYGYHFCRTLKPILEHIAPSTTLKIVNKSRFSELSIPVPPLSEQRRIAAILDKAEELRVKRGRSVAQLGRLTESAFTDMFEQSSAAGGAWKTTTIGEVAEVQGGLQLSAARKSLPCEVPYLRVANVFRNRLDLSEIKMMRATSSEIARTLLVAGDLLVVEGHGNPKEIGRCAMWDGSVQGCVHQNHLIRVRLDRSVINPTFASRFLNSRGGRQHLLRAGKTTSGLNTISVSDVKRVPIPVPPMEMQRAFEQQVTARDHIVAQQVASSQNLDNLFESLQYRAFRGEL